MMNNKFTLELLWWVVTAVVVALFILPIYFSAGEKYDFYISNIVLIVIFITLTRYMFLLKHTWLDNKRWAKLIFIFLPIPLLLYATDELFNFQFFADSESFTSLYTHLKPEEATSISNYIRYQYVFFGTGAIMTLFMFPIRMIISIWKKMNR